MGIHSLSNHGIHTPIRSSPAVDDASGGYFL